MADASANDKGFLNPKIECEKHEVTAQTHSGKELKLDLYQMHHEGCPPVLLLHGGSAQHETFCVPRRGASMAEYLWENGYEPWLLDWRASFKVTDRLEGDLDHWREKLDFDNAAEFDLPKAIEKIREVRDDQNLPVHILGHCLGAGVLAHAVAEGYVKPPGRIVLLTLGLFYSQPARGKLKSSLDVLDKLWTDGKSVVDPRSAVAAPESPDREDGWPAEVERAYQRLGREIGPHRDQDADPASCFGLCDRISFMFGEPYIEGRLAPEVHGRWVIRFSNGKDMPVPGDRLLVVDRKDLSKPSPSGVVLEVDWHPQTSWRVGDAIGRVSLSGVQGELPSDEPFDRYVIVSGNQPDKAVATYGGLEHSEGPELPKQFGAIPLRMYLQGAENARRGWAARFIERAERQERRQKANSSATSDDASSGDGNLIGKEALNHFHGFEAVTLITGKENTLWYRKSIDDMYEWLLKKPKSECKVTRKLVEGYGHQDLLWGKDAKEDVFETILDGLGGSWPPVNGDPLQP